MMQFTPRNGISAVTLPSDHIESVDNLFDICDAEFNSRKDIHESFKQARGAASWARHFLLHEVRSVADREGIYCSYHMAYVIASKLSEIWFEQKELA